jgi:Kef-type K+ transport system membrane component KefB
MTTDPLGHAFLAASGHGDPVSLVVLFVAIILVGARIGAEMAERFGQPAVLGELLFGVVLGNLPLLGVRYFEAIGTDPHIDMLARIGVLILLFEVGLESTVRQMVQVGVSSLIVAVLGVIAPFGLGWAASLWLLPDSSSYVHAFIGATLTATSVGITARVLKDLQSSQSPEARVILGAAVIDDVLGLVILAVVTGMIAAANAGADFSLFSVGGTLGKASLFLFGSLIIGAFMTPRIFKLASRLHTHGVLLAFALAWCFLLSWLANTIELAPIVGAFAAGLILESAHFQDFRSRGERELEDLIHPIASILVPVFFVLMGVRTDLASFMQPGLLTLAAALTVAAILGKQVCSFGVMAKGIDRVTVGIGMVPRGEVGLIFANIGLGLTLHGERILTESVFSAVVLMVIVTTLITPPALKWSMSRGSARYKAHP